MINEAIFVLAGSLATAEDIDNGMRLGTNQPIAGLADMIGLDTMLAVMQVFYEGLQRFQTPARAPAQGKWSPPVISDARPGAGFIPTNRPVRRSRPARDGAPTRVFSRI